jgi:hypothetical protein
MESRGKVERGGNKLAVLMQQIATQKADLMPLAVDGGFERILAPPACPLRALFIAVAKLQNEQKYFRSA